MVWVDTAYLSSWTLVGSVSKLPNTGLWPNEGLDFSGRRGSESLSPGDPSDFPKNT